MGRIVKMERWEIRCNLCQQLTHVYMLPGHPYGRLIGRTCDNGMVEVDVFSEPLYKQISALIREHTLDSIRAGACFRHILGIMTDAASSGERYDFSGKFSCISCDFHDVEFNPVVPNVLEEIELPYASHGKWSKMSKTDLEHQLTSIIYADGYVQ